MDLAAGTVIAGRYEVDQLLGRGGMATVYRVYHLGLGTSHALKVLAISSGTVRERMLREGRLQGQIHHPNVVAVTDQVEVGGLPGLVLEMVEGPSLAALVGGPPLSVEQIDQLGAGILAGVAEAHRHRLVHRDLKPANVLVAIREGKPVPKVSDFGLAVALDDEGPRATRTGAHLGTPQYMAPEQVRDAKSVDERADVWALGVLLYELAAGHLPFQHADRLELFKAIASGEHVPLHELRPDLPDRMRHTIERALTVDLDERPADAVALCALWGERTVPVIDPLVDRVMSLAPPPSSRGASSVPASAATSDAPQTWAPETRVAEPAPTAPAPRPAPVAQVTSFPSEVPSESLPPQPPVHVPAVAPAAMPTWVPAVVAGSAVAALTAVVVALLLVVVLSRPPEPTTVVVPVPAAPVAPEAAPPTPFGVPPKRLPEKGRDRLLDGRFLDAMYEADFFLAVQGSEAEILSSTAHRAREAWYPEREELDKGTRADGDSDRSRVFLDMLSDPARADEWLVTHPDDLEARVMYVATACPGPYCASAAPHAASLERDFPGRGIGDWARSIVLRESGKLAESESAWKRWAALAPDEAMVAVERGRWLIASKRYEDAVAAVSPTLEKKKKGRPPVGAWVVAGLAHRELGEAGAVIELEARLQNELWEVQVGYARAVAAWEAGRGDSAAAIRRLDEARGSFDRYNDELVKLIDVEISLQELVLAVDAGDAAAQERAALALAAVRSMEHRPWARAFLDRAGLLAEGLRMVGRGRTSDARRILEQLEAAGATPHETQALRDRV
ncbi:MAG: serine/threonine protein kinase [Alphaproteobacteria bacterium]|nr:serine/threonine protein kinase [Alphaproteobacteria bacterium]